MNKPGSSFRKPFYTVVSLIVLSLLWVIQSGYPITQQMRNLKAAARHAPVINVLLQHDARFAEVQAGSWTGEGGCLMIHGVLASESDLPDLRKIVELSKPPLRVRYYLQTSAGDWVPG
ncbi:hypothetical protein [Prosthecobacter sp.]|uniref:hypothetical protein n=1 Tax=Prosthecobacter sp. TaxID=1965333 RepID=UPI00378480CB